MYVHGELKKRDKSQTFFLSRAHHIHIYISPHKIDILPAACKLGAGPRRIDSHALVKRARVLYLYLSLYVYITTYTRKFAVSLSISRGVHPSIHRTRQVLYLPLYNTHSFCRARARAHGRVQFVLSLVPTARLTFNPRCIIQNRVH